jgi:hypothetical protein
MERTSLAKLLVAKRGATVYRCIQAKEKSRQALPTENRWPTAGRDSWSAGCHILPSAGPWSVGVGVCFRRPVRVIGRVFVVVEVKCSLSGGIRRDRGNVVKTVYRWACGTGSDVPVAKLLLH